MQLMGLEVCAYSCGMSALSHLPAALWLQASGLQQQGGSAFGAWLHQQDPLQG